MSRPLPLPGPWRLVAAGALLLVFALATIGRADADLWGHLRYGLDAIHDRGLTSDDPYSFTQDTPWVNHEWLSEVQTAAAWILGGVPGLVLLKAGLVFGGFWVLWGSLTGVRFGPRLGLLLFAAVGTVHITAFVRPQAWTFLFFSLLCAALASRRLDLRRWLPLLFAVWANTHGGWVVGLGVLGVWAVLEALADREARTQWLWLAPVSALATGLTPYGWRLWEFIFRTVRPERAISEWQPIFTKDIGFWGPWLVAVGLGLWAIWRLPARRLPTLAVLAMLAWSSYDVMRISSLFAVATVVLLAPVFRARWPAPPRPSLQPKRGEWLVAAYLALMCVAGAVWIGSRTLTCLPIGGTWAPEAEAMLVLESAPPGRLVTFFDWGQYALWHVGPDVKVSMDGRRETVYSDARLAEHDAIIDGRQAGLDALALWRAEYVWLPAESTATRDWLVTNGYRIDYESERSFVAVRVDLPRLEAIDARIDRCFPR